MTNKKFCVTVYEVYSFSVHVAAQTEDEALDKVQMALFSAGKLPNGEEVPPPKYEYLLDVDEWDVMRCEE